MINLINVNYIIININFMMIIYYFYYYLEHELRLNNFDFTLNTGNSSIIYKYDIPHHIKKIILHKARLYTTNFNAFQPTSIANNGIKILCALMKCKLNQSCITSNHINRTSPITTIDHHRNIQKTSSPIRYINTDMLCNYILIIFILLL